MCASDESDLTVHSPAPFASLHRNPRAHNATTSSPLLTASIPRPPPPPSSLVALDRAHHPPGPTPEWDPIDTGHCRHTDGKKSLNSADLRLRRFAAWITLTASPTRPRALGMSAAEEGGRLCPRPNEMHALIIDSRPALFILFILFIQRSERGG